MKPELIEELPDQDHIRPSHRKWRCRCGYCGKEFEARLSNLKNGHTKSCSCERNRKTKERSTTHGMTGTRTYAEHRDMMQRCYNKNHKDYHRYGGRGIEVCGEWHTFEGFFACWGVIPDDRTLDRENNDGSYVPGNCRLATDKEQARNRSNNRHILAFGRTQLLIEWSEETGLKTDTIANRIDKQGYTPEQALATPPGQKRVENPTTPLRKKT